MDFLKAKRFPKFRKSKKQDNPHSENSPLPSEIQADGLFTNSPAKDKGLFVNDDVNGDADDEEEEEEDDDCISSEVKRRLKELRKNAFMVLIPEEESFLEEEEETSSSEWRDAEIVNGYPQCGFHALYDQYCERMLFFDKMISQQLQEEGCYKMSNSSQRSTTKKLASTLRRLPFKRHDDLQCEGELLEQLQGDESCQSLEVAYVAQISLSWEALHCQYTELSQMIASQPEDPKSYDFTAQDFQQFQVLLQRFVENEPFGQGPRVYVYTQSRISLPKLLQVPNVKGLSAKEYESCDIDQPSLRAVDLLAVMKESILTFHQFLKTDKKRSGNSLNPFRGHDPISTSLQQVQSSLEKREMKVKELMRKQKGWKKDKKKEVWPKSSEGVDLLFAFVDVKVVSRALRMVRVSKEQLLWCEEKMSKLDLTESRLRRDGTPILFPC